MKHIYLFLIGIVVVSCSSKKSIAEKTANYLSTEKIINQHYKSSFKAETMNAKVYAVFDNEKNRMGADVSLRMEKGKIIWMSVSKFGFTIAKLKITPQNVQYYEKWQKVYFDGDFSLISNKLGIELNFEQLENILLGQSIEKLYPNNYVSEIQKNTYKLTEKEMEKIFSFQFLINAVDFKINKQSVLDRKEQRHLTIDYKNYQTIGKETLPKHVIIKATENNKSTEITLSYKQVETGKSLRFPFRIPSGYKKIKL